MSDTTTAQDVKTVAVQIAKIAAKSTAQAAVETAGAIVLLAGVGLVANKVQTRRAKKLATQAE